jgi:uncharacterized membrane protein YeiB
MLEWNPRLVTLLLAAAAFATAVGLSHVWLEAFNHGW